MTKKPPVVEDGGDPVARLDRINRCAERDQPRRRYDKERLAYFPEQHESLFPLRCNCVTILDA